MEAQMYNLQRWIPETEPTELVPYFNNLLKDSGFNILKVAEHYFDPHGYTGLWLLSESHFAIHTFPEEGKSYIELSSCIKTQYERFVVGLSK